MQIVIEISESTYDYIRDCDSENYIVTTELYNAVYDGIPLPEKHGRLIDADGLKKRIEETAINPYAMRGWVYAEILNAPSVIERSES